MIPVVISGGSGTRLWPVSRSSYPKQFCEFYDHSFLRNTIDRVSAFGKIHLVTVESMRTMTLKILRETQLSPESLICEPFGKNTAPAVALICHVLSQRKMTDEIVGIFPADHLISEVKKFQEVVRLAESVAQKGEVVTLGIAPRYAATGYGYIELSDVEEGSRGEFKARKVKQFLEKPNAAKAKEFAQTGKHFWNAGVFVFKVGVMIQHFEKKMPQLWDRIKQIKADMSNAPQVYANVESQSIDFGLIEKLEKMVCIPCEIGWSDVGSWDELARLDEEMPQYRSDSKAKVFSEDASGNYVFSVREKVIGLVGVKNLIVVETPDALLISQKGKSEKVREIVKSVRTQGLPEATEQKFELRPWGKFEVLADASDYKAKKITVDAGEQLSYQSHEKRSEHWIIIEGEGEVTLDDKKNLLRGGQYIYISQNAKHRIKNTGKGPLTFIEVQTGSYFGEDDIKRYQDDYNRV